MNANENERHRNTTNTPPPHISIRLPISHSSQKMGYRRLQCARQTSRLQVKCTPREGWVGYGKGREGGCGGRVSVLGGVFILYFVFNFLYGV